MVWRNRRISKNAAFDLYGRGDEAALQKESAEAEAARDKIYAIFDQFSRGIDTELLADEAKDLYRDYGDELRYQDMYLRMSIRPAESGPKSHSRSPAGCI